MGSKSKIKEQLFFKFGTKKIYKKEDFYVTPSNKEAFETLNLWPKWIKKNVNIYGPKGSGKSHLATIFEKKVPSVKIQGKDLTDDIFIKFKIKEALIIEDLDRNISEKLLYSLINFSQQDNKYILITSKKSLVSINFNLGDLKSRVNSFNLIGIKLPTDDLINVILMKNFSDRQITIDKKHINYIIKRTDRSYEKISQFVSNLDNYSLRKGTAINFKIIKEVLKVLQK